MCGIVGIISFKKLGFFNKDIEVFKDLLIVNSLRGAHSTGIFGGHLNEAEVDFIKMTGTPHEFLAHADVIPVWNKMNLKYNYMVGHGRHATRGEITSANAHPFQVEHITMVHNGTIYNSELVEVKKYAVDSYALAEALTKYPAEKVFGDVNGAFAVVWFDSKTKCLSMVRNKERPLAVGIDKTNNNVLFASEKGMLSLVAERRGITLDKLFYIPENTIISFDNVHSFTQKKIEKKSFISNFLPDKKQEHIPKNTGYGKQGRIVQVTSKSSGEVFKLEEYVKCLVSEIIPFKMGKEKESFHVYGTIKGTSEMECSFIWYGEKELLLQEGLIWQGEIASIAYAPLETKKRGKEYVFYLKNTQPYNNIIALLNKDTHITLYGGETMPKEEFLERIKNGCDGCKSPLDKADATKLVWYDPYLFCPECSGEMYDEVLENKNAC